MLLAFEMRVSGATTPHVRPLSYTNHVTDMGAPSMLVKVCICTIIFLSGLCKLTPKVRVKLTDT